MNLSKIISVSGKPGLYEIISQAKNSFLVKEIESQKKTTISSRFQVSLLNNIAVYTDAEDVPLEDVLARIYKKEDGKQSISHNEDIEELREYLETILPNYDKSRVYASDIKKIFKWYNLLQSKNLLEPEIEPEEVKSKPKPNTKTAKKKE